MSDSDVVAVLRPCGLSGRPQRAIALRSCSQMNRSASAAVRRSPATILSPSDRAVAFCQATFIFRIPRSLPFCPHPVILGPANPGRRLRHGYGQNTRSRLHSIEECGITFHCARGRDVQKPAGRITRSPQSMPLETHKATIASQQSPLICDAERRFKRIWDRHHQRMQACGIELVILQA